MNAVTVLVTGGRSRTDAQVIDNVLWEAYVGLVVAGPYREFRVMHGNNKGGVDAIADRWAINRYYEGVRVKRVDAGWSAPCTPSCQPGHRRVNTSGVEFCPAQGNYRNQTMVDLHPHAVVAFPGVGKSVGTWDCVQRAIKANIPTLICRFGQQPVWATPDLTAWVVS